MCKILGASHYLNVAAGKELYVSEDFKRQGISLEFLTPQLSEYPQQGIEEFVPGLSILDLIFRYDAGLVLEQMTQGQVEVGHY